MLTWPFRRRLLLVAISIVIYFALFMALNWVQVGLVPIMVLVIAALMLGSGLLGAIAAVPFSLVLIVGSRLIIGTLNPLLSYPGLVNPVITFLGMTIFGGVAGVFGSLLRRLRHQQVMTLQAMQALQASETRYRRLVEDIGDVAYTCDASGYCTYASPSAQALTGFPIDALLGAHFFKLVADDWQERVAVFYDRQFQAQTPETVLQFPIMTATGQRKWVEQRVALVQEAAHVTGFQSIVRDITRRKSLEREMEMARDQALEALRVKTQTLAMISHDSRTPLSVIALRSELLKREHYGPLNDKQREILDSVLLNVHEALNFFNNLLQRSKFEMTSRADPDRREIVPGLWLGALVETIKPLADHKGLGLTISVDRTIPPMIATDPDWLKHIVTNLVSNAIKFTDEGTVIIRIQRPDLAHWAIQVADSGAGMAAEEQAQIFEAFWQADAAQTPGQGVGLGLSIVDNYVKRLGGTIDLESAPGQGSTFTVTMPLELDDDETIVSESPSVTVAV